MRFSTSLRELIGKRDFYAGGLMLLLGLGIAVKGSTYRGGTLMHMGPGFLPTALGIILVLLGITIAAASLAGDGDSDEPRPEYFAGTTAMVGLVLHSDESGGVHLLRPLFRHGAGHFRLRIHCRARR